jgi:hypothetical protein
VAKLNHTILITAYHKAIKDLQHAKRDNNVMVRGHLRGSRLMGAWRNLAGNAAAPFAALPDDEDA